MFHCGMVQLVLDLPCTLAHILIEHLCTAVLLSTLSLNPVQDIVD